MGKSYNPIITKCLKNTQILEGICVKNNSSVILMVTVYAINQNRDIIRKVALVCRAPSWDCGKRGRTINMITSVARLLNMVYVP